MVMDANGRSHRPAGLPAGMAGTYEPAGGAGGDGDLALENARMVAAETHVNAPESYGTGDLHLRERRDHTGRTLYDDRSHVSIHVGARGDASDAQMAAVARAAAVVSKRGYLVDVSDGRVTVAADGRRGVFNLDTGDMAIYRDGREESETDFTARPGAHGFALGDDENVDAMLRLLAERRTTPKALRDLVNSAMPLRSPNALTRR